MPSKGWKRTWVKLFVTGWLHGSIRWQLEPDERSVWADLICLAGQCGHEGVICDNDGQPLPRDFIASQFNIKQTLLDRTIAKSIHDNRLKEIEGCLSIVNWASYQSEYERQKPFRQKKSIIERNAQRLREHPDEAHGFVHDPDGNIPTHEAYGFATHEEWEKDEEQNLARGDTPLEVHEQAMCEANPDIEQVGLKDYPP